jgi:glycosyltransferase involved in cell wall biosynthesis
VTSEITNHELALIGRDIPSFTLTNSIDVKKYPLKNHRVPYDDTMRLLYVGSNTTDWHGLDRLLKGLADFHGKIQLELHLAGDVSVSIQKLVRSLKIQDHVIFHGYLTGKDLDMLFDISDLAIGTLGMHRKKLTYGSTLKVREYMARGIPFMISYTDDDLSPDLPYVFNAPPDDRPIDMDKVTQFTKGIYSAYGADVSQQMRTYACEHMDYRVKTIKLIDFINSLHQSS